MLMIGLSAATLTSCGGDKKTRDPFAYDAARPLGARVEHLGPRGEVELDRVTYSATDGEQVPALFARVPPGRPRKGCLVFELGLGTKKEDAEFAWTGAARLGLSTFTIDLRNHGERAASPDAWERAAGDPALLASMVRGTVLDLRRALDYLEQQPACRRNVGYAGVSLGGIIGALLAGRDERVRATALLSTPSSWRVLVDDTDAILPGLEQDPEALRAALRRLAPLDPDRWVGRIAPRPVIVFSGSDDPVVPPASAHGLYAAARQPKSLVDYRGAHDPFAAPDGAGNATRLANFLKTELADSGGTMSDVRGPLVRDGGAGHALHRRAPRPRRCCRQAADLSSLSSILLGRSQIGYSLFVSPCRGPIRSREHPRG